MTLTCGTTEKPGSTLSGIALYQPAEDDQPKRPRGILLAQAAPASVSAAPAVVTPGVTFTLARPSLVQIYTRINDKIQARGEFTADEKQALADIISGKEGSIAIIKKAQADLEEAAGAIADTLNKKNIPALAWPKLLTDTEQELMPPACSIDPLNRPTLVQVYARIAEKLEASNDLTADEKRSLNDIIKGTDGAIDTIKKAQAALEEPAGAIADTLNKKNVPDYTWPKLYVDTERELLERTCFHVDKVEPVSAKQGTSPTLKVTGLGLIKGVTVAVDSADDITLKDQLAKPPVNPLTEISVPASIAKKAAKGQRKVVITAPWGQKEERPLTIEEDKSTEEKKSGLVIEIDARVNFNTGHETTPYNRDALTARPNLDVERARVGQVVEEMGGTHPMAAAQKKLYDERTVAGLSVLPTSVPTDLNWSAQAGGSLAVWESGAPKPDSYHLGASGSGNIKDFWFPFASLELRGQGYDQPTRGLFQDAAYLRGTLSPAQIGHVWKYGEKGDRSFGVAFRPISWSFLTSRPGELTTLSQLKMTSRFDSLFTSGLDLSATIHPRVKLNAGVNALLPISRRSENGTLTYTPNPNGGSNDPLVVEIHGNDFNATGPATGGGTGTTNPNGTVTTAYDPKRRLSGYDILFSADITALSDGLLTLTPLLGFSQFNVGQHDGFEAYSRFGGLKAASTLGTSSLFSLTGLGGVRKPDPYLSYDGAFARVMLDMALGQERDHTIFGSLDYQKYNNNDKADTGSKDFATYTIGLGYRFRWGGSQPAKASGKETIYGKAAAAAPETAPTPAAAGTGLNDSKAE